MSIVSEPKPYTVKVVLVGESAVGKTSTISRFQKKAAPSPSVPTTIGTDFTVKSIERHLNGGRQIVQVQLWDTAGQERFRTITPMTYKNAHCVVVCYDITNRKTYDESVKFDQAPLKFWASQLQQHAGPNVVTCLVGNKTDLQEAREVQTAEGKELAAELGLVHFFEISAKTGDCVEDMFLAVIDDALSRVMSQEAEGRPSSVANGFSLVENNNKKEGCKC